MSPFYHMWPVYVSIYALNMMLHRNVYGIDQHNRWCVFPADFIIQGTSGVCNFLGGLNTIRVMLFALWMLSQESSGW